MPGQILLAGGLVEDESELEEIEMWQEAVVEAGVSEERRMGRARFSRMYFSFFVFLLFIS